MKTTLETLVLERGSRILIYEYLGMECVNTLEISSYHGNERFEPRPFIVEIEEGGETHSIHLDRDRAKGLVEWLQRALAESATP